jgi:hypothetical protein
MNATLPTALERLWRSAHYLPESARLLGTRYRALFLSYAGHSRPEGDIPALADALAFTEFVQRQQRLALLPPELTALRRDARHLRRGYRLCRQGDVVTAVEKGRLRRWLGL